MLEFLNPSYKLDIIPFVEDEKYTLRLPRPATGTFVNNEAAIYNFAESQLAETKKNFQNTLRQKTGFATGFEMEII